MTVLIKIGRRVHRKFTQRAKGPMLVQMMLWKNIEYGLGLATQKMKIYSKKNPDTFTFTKKTYKEEDSDSLTYNIQWIEIIINSTPEIEEEEYNDTMKFYSDLESNRLFKKGTEDLEIDDELAKEYNKNLSKGKIKKMLDAGYERVKHVTLNKSLNDVGIITIVEKYEKEVEEE